MAHEFPPEMQSSAVFMSQNHYDFDCNDTKSNRNNNKKREKEENNLVVMYYVLTFALDFV